MRVTTAFLGQPTMRLGFAHDKQMREPRGKNDGPALEEAFAALLAGRLRLLFLGLSRRQFMNGAS
jgi:hypothetical protein